MHVKAHGPEAFSGLEAYIIFRSWHVAPSQASTSEAWFVIHWKLCYAFGEITTKHGTIFSRKWTAQSVTTAVEFSTTIDNAKTCRCRVYPDVRRTFAVTM